MDISVADGLAPRDYRRRGEYWRQRCIDVNIAVGQLQERITSLERELRNVIQDRNYILRRSVTLTVAEEARRRAAAGMRERAACLMEDIGGAPSARSEAIRAIPDPKPKWRQL